MKKNQNKNITILALSFLALIGTYNAVMINSETTLSNSTNLQRLDEMTASKSGRSLAVATDWRKVPKTLPVIEAETPAVAKSNVIETPSQAPIASIQETLDMKLVEVVNPKKWATGVTADKFNGTISTNDGVIESLVANLPGNFSIDISFSEMNGNVFEYDLNGEVFSGMMYQVDHSAYMITLSNGPLEGTRLKFAGEAKDSEAFKAQADTFLAETHNVEVQNFGSEAEVQEVQISETASTIKLKESSFNFKI